MDNGSIGTTLIDFGTGSAADAPSLDVGSTAIEYLPTFPGDLITAVGNFLKNFGL